MPLIADPGDATATSIQVSAAQERVRFQPGDAIQLIEGDHRLRNEISEVIEGEDTITFALVDEIGADLTQAAQITGASECRTDSHRCAITRRWRLESGATCYKRE